MGERGFGPRERRRVVTRIAGSRLYATELACGVSASACLVRDYPPEDLSSLLGDAGNRAPRTTSLQLLSPPGSTGSS
jgi:hypothetical protein